MDSTAPSLQGKNCADPLIGHGCKSLIICLSAIAAVVWSHGPAGPTEQHGFSFKIKAHRHRRYSVVNGLPPCSKKAICQNHTPTTDRKLACHSTFLGLGSISLSIEMIYHAGLRLLLIPELRSQGAHVLVIYLSTWSTGRLLWVLGVRWFRWLSWV